VPNQIERKRTAIFTADAERHWRLMGSDQQGTPDRLSIT
jgi:hypothetical protein